MRTTTRCSVSFSREGIAGTVCPFREPATRLNLFQCKKKKGFGRSGICDTRLAKVARQFSEKSMNFPCKEGRSSNPLKSARAILLYNLVFDNN